jgi:NAD(P)-dependent dehydrogenase (short-subunit alcohol dehydrogenase family)
MSAFTELEGKVAVVTGGASGIGKGIAQALAGEGAKLVIADIEQGALDAAAEELGATGIRTDVSDAGSVQALADEVVDRFGTAHVVVNNAGIGPIGRIADLTLDDWKWIVGVNLWGVIHGIHAFLPILRGNAEGGHIVNTASMAGLIASQGLGVYNTSKYAVVGLSETLAKDLKAYGIGVSVLCPMGVETRIRESERSRPAALRNEGGAVEPAVELIGRYLAPASVADMVLDAVRRGELYVITHDEGLEPLRRRFDRMQQSVLKRRKA